MVNEHELIQHVLAPLVATNEAALAFHDDAAVVSVSDQCLVYTKDAMVAGIHFFADDNPALIAKKLLRCNLSDLAAMGATPRYYLIALIAPDTMTQSWVKAFYQSLASEQEHFQINMLGGDTVSHQGALTLSLTAIGELDDKRLALLRSGARIGDSLFVSGTIGDSYAGLQLRSGAMSLQPGYQADYLTDRYHVPRPRIALGCALSGRASACIDVSDGLIQDAKQIIHASNYKNEQATISITIDLDTVPFSSAVTELLAQRLVTEIDLVTGGDDYELLFSGTFGNKVLNELAASTGTTITRIGSVTTRNSDNSDLNIIQKGRDISIKLDQCGYQHHFGTHLA